MQSVKKYNKPVRNNEKLYIARFLKYICKKFFWIIFSITNKPLSNEVYSVICKGDIKVMDKIGLNPFERRMDIMYFLSNVRETHYVLSF